MIESFGDLDLRPQDLPGNKPGRYGIIIPSPHLVKPVFTLLADLPGPCKGEGLVIIACMSQKLPIGTVGIAVRDRSRSIGQKQRVAHLVKMIGINFVVVRGIDHVKESAPGGENIEAHPVAGGLVFLGHYGLQPHGIVVIVMQGGVVVRPGQKIVEAVVGQCGI